MDVSVSDVSLPPKKRVSRPSSSPHKETTAGMRSSSGSSTNFQEEEDLEFVTPTAQVSKLRSATSHPSSSGLNKKQVSFTPGRSMSIRSTSSSGKVKSRVPTPGPAKKSATPLLDPGKLRKRLLSSERLTRSSRAGLLLPVSRAERVLRSTPRARVSELAPVMLTAAVQYVTTELLDLAAEQAAEEKRKRLQPRHLQRAMARDGELFKLMKNCILPEAGITFQPSH